tara:strand:- start:876 stop:1514 length:639 start_codon:yes stop_codon:yes gene_type:complete
MYIREITGALIGMFVLAIILFASSFTFKLVLFGIFIIAFIELFLLTRRPYWSSLLVIFFIITSLFFLETYEANRLLFLYSILISALNDSGAYYLGKKFGSRKVFPETSPNKTLEGLISGILISSCILYLINYQEVFKLNINYLDNQNSFLFLILLISSTAAVFGDYLESRIKRLADVKDSGSLLPGHGGILDRIDSHIFAIPIFFILVGAVL